MDTKVSKEGNLVYLVRIMQKGNTKFNSSALKFLLRSDDRVEYEVERC